MIETVKRFSPDLLGTQETLPFQRDYLLKQLPGFQTVAAGRDDGKPIVWLARDGNRDAVVAVTPRDRGDWRIGNLDRSHPMGSANRLSLVFEPNEPQTEHR